MVSRANREHSYRCNRQLADIVGHPCRFDLLIGSFSERESAMRRVAVVGLYSILGLVGCAALGQLPGAERRSQPPARISPATFTAQLVEPPTFLSCFICGTLPIRWGPPDCGTIADKLDVRGAI